MERGRRHRPSRVERSADQQDEPLFFSELKRLTDEVIPRSGVTGIVVYGAGRHFSSGADLDDLIRAIGEGTPEGSDEKTSALLIDNLRSFRFFEEMNVPVVAAIRGVCLGSALELALFCHGRICAAGSVLGLPESSFGLIPGCGGIQQMQALTGLSRTMELVLTGATFDAEEAYQWKIVDKIVGKNDAVSTAVDVIRAVSPGYNKYRIGSYLRRQAPERGALS